MAWVSTASDTIYNTVNTAGTANKPLNNAGDQGGGATTTGEWRLHQIKANEILQLLQILFDTPNNSGFLLIVWKSANITAIYNKGYKKDPTN